MSHSTSYHFVEKSRKTWLVSIVTFAGAFQSLNSPFSLDILFTVLLDEPPVLSIL
jgi:hypothetical protein